MRSQQGSAGPTAGFLLRILGEEEAVCKWGPHLLTSLGLGCEEDTLIADPLPEGRG